MKTLNENGTPTKEAMELAQERYNYCINSFEFLIDELERKYEGNLHWHTWGVKSGKKFLTHSRTINNLLWQEVHIEKEGKKTRFIDFSSVFSLLRVQIENYAIFFHLFGEKCNIEERILRFRLWQLDGVKTRHMLSPRKDPELEKDELEKILMEIKKIKYFQSLKPKVQEYLIKNKQWKFTDESLKQPNKNKWKISIEDLITKTRIKENKLFENWYSFTSMHTHTSFLSVVQHETHSLDQKIMAQYIGLMQGLTVICTYYFDLVERYQFAKDYYKELPEVDKRVLESFDQRRK